MATINVIQDYDDYFSNWAKSLAEELNNLNSSIKVIHVDSGPYRSYGMQYHLTGNELYLDLYSAVRNGFGSIGCSPKDLAKELEQLS